MPARLAPYGTPPDPSGYTIATLSDGSPFFCIPTVTGQVGTKAVSGVVIPPSAGEAFNLWHGTSCQDPNPVFLDRTRVHQIRAPEDLGGLFHMFANPTIRCTVDPNGLQFCRDPQVPGLTPQVKWALAGVDRDVYDLMLWVQTEENGYVVRNVDDPNILFEDIADPDGPDRAESFNGLGNGSSDPDLNPDENPWVFEFWLVSEGTSSTGWTPPIGEEPLGQAFIRAAPNGVMTVNDPTCLASDCQVVVDQLLAQNFFPTLVEVAEIRGPDDVVLWPAQGSPLMIPSPSGEEWLSITLDLDTVPVGKFDLRFIGRSKNLTDDPGTPPYVHDVEIDRVSISALASSIPATVARLNSTQNPCQALTRAGCTELKCDEDLLVEGEILTGDQVGLYKVTPAPLNARYLVACFDDTTTLPATVNLGCSNSPSAGGQRSFELLPGCSTSPAPPHVPFDALSLAAHPPIDPGSGESLVCSTNNKALTTSDTGSLGIIITELGLPGIDASGACLNDVNYQRAQAVADQLPAGVRYIRRSVRWEEVQPVCTDPANCEAPDFRRYQCLLEPFDNKGYEFILTLTRTPDWACQVPPGPGENVIGECVPNINHWGNFVTSALNNLQAKSFEIWQEPELDKFFLGTGADYKAILEEAYNRAASVTPRPEIWGGNVVFGQYKRSHLMEEFMHEILDPDNVIMDGLTIHDFREFGDSDGGVANSVRYTRQFLDSLVSSTGDKPYENFPLAVSAFSYAAEPFSPEACLFKDLTSAEQEQHLRDEMICGLTAGADSMTWFSSTDRRFWQCGADQATGLDRADGLGVLENVINSQPPFVPGSLVKPQMAAPFTEVGCAIDPTAVGCP